VIDSLPIVNIVPNYTSGLILGAVPNTYSQYQWFVNGSVIPGATGTTYTPSFPGDYKVQATNGQNCSNFSPLFHYANGASVNNVNGGGDIVIYPNPASSVIHIEAQVKVNVDISSIEGKVVMHQDNATTMDINPLANGVYMIKVYSKEGILLKIDRLVKNGY
jgi:hypothetical protein